MPEALVDQVNKALAFIALEHRVLIPHILAGAKRKNQKIVKAKHEFIEWLLNNVVQFHRGHPPALRLRREVDYSCGWREISCPSIGSLLKLDHSGKY